MIFQKLKFELGAPTPIHFLRRFSKAAQADGQTHTLSKYFIELAAIDYNLSEYMPSEVSFALNYPISFIHSVINNFNIKFMLIDFQIAAAALFISLSLIHRLVNDKPVKFGSLWNPVLEFYSTYTAADLRPIVKELIAYIMTVPSSKNNNVYTKYTSQKHGEMSLICERSKHILNEILEQE